MKPDAQVHQLLQIVDNVEINQPQVVVVKFPTL